MSSVEERPVRVAQRGGVFLGKDFVCDGFHSDVPNRVQTHIHDDHMERFSESKANQDIYLTEPTKDLLAAEFQEVIEYRTNIHAIPFGQVTRVGDSKLTLIPSNHMLGGAQVCVELSDGHRVGYSSDFGWPIEEVIKVDTLVVDSTYGSPDSIRSFSQAAAEMVLVEQLRAKLDLGSVHVKAHRGTLQRALQVIVGQIDCPILATSRRCREIEVYRRHAYPIADVLDKESDEGRAAKENGRCIFLYAKADQMPVNYDGDCSIFLTSAWTKGDPLLEYNDRSCRVGLSDHADFQQSLEYIEQTGATFVLTDSSRGGNAIDFAQNIARRLNVESRPAVFEKTLVWGA